MGILSEVSGDHKRKRKKRGRKYRRASDASWKSTGIKL